MPTVAYIAHPIGDAPTMRVDQVRFIQYLVYQDEPGVIPFAPYLRAVECLDDAVQEDRERGMAHNRHFLTSGIVDELRLYGPWVSRGMWEEIRIALNEQIPIRAMTEGVKTDLENSPVGRAILASEQHTPT